MNIVRVAQDLKKFPDEVMRWMGYPEWAVRSSAAWTFVVYQDVLASDRAIAEFEREKARQKAKARRGRGR